MPAEYRLCAAETADELSEMVSQLFRDGWDLYGDPFFGTPEDKSPDSGDIPHQMFCQALTKTTHKQKPGVY